MALFKMKGAIAKNLHGRTDWNKLKNLTDAQIRAAVATDTDAKIIDSNRLLSAKRGRQT
ncbi:hypothetical protein V8J88_18195 [Massilia sp. W12]|uniref:hypothetical protein n=1 Tax=Massilia sp. W12 TaxID=3126507 RepID=UPI0030D29765